MHRTAEMLPRATTIRRRLLEKKMSPAWSLTCSTKKRVSKRPLSTCRLGAELCQSLRRQTKHASLHPCHKRRIQSSSIAFRLPCDMPETYVRGTPVLVYLSMFIRTRHGLAKSITDKEPFCSTPHCMSRGSQLASLHVFDTLIGYDFESRSCKLKVVAALARVLESCLLGGLVTSLSESHSSKSPGAAGSVLMEEQTTISTPVVAEANFLPSKIDLDEDDGLRRGWRGAICQGCG